MKMQYISHMKKIGIVSFGLSGAGVEKVLLNMLCYIDYSKYDVSLWIPDQSVENLDQVPADVHLHKWSEFLMMPVSGRVKRIWKQTGTKEAIHSIKCQALSYFYGKIHRWEQSDFWLYRGLKGLSEEHYDVVIAYHTMPLIQHQIALYTLNADKRICWIHSDAEHAASRKDRKKYEKVYPRYDHVICVSEAVENSLKRCYPMIEGKTRVIYNLQNIQRILELSRESVKEPFFDLTLVTVGRLSREKGQDMIPGIAKNLLQRGYRFIWYVVGDGTLKPELEARIREERLEDAVKLLGAKTNPYPYIKNCSLYVQPSYTEGFCVATQEAKILGAHAVVTDVTGMREQFAEGEATFAEPTVESLTAAIMKALETIDEPVSYEPVTEAYNERELQKLYNLIG